MRTPLLVAATLLLAGCASLAARPGQNLVPDGAGFTVVEIAPRYGSFKEQVIANLRRADSLRQTPYFELSAAWCGPCQAFEKSLHDPGVMRSLRGTYIMRVDIDKYHMPNGDQVAAAIPIFLAVDTAGFASTHRQVGLPITPADMALAFERFFHPPVSATHEVGAAQ